MPPKSLSKIQSDKNENKYSYNLNKTYQPKNKNREQYAITTLTQKEDKKGFNRDNKERNTKGEIKKNNTTQKYNTYRQQSKNINDYCYYESFYNENPKENKYLTNHK